MLDRLNRLEEQAHAQKYTPLHRILLQKIVPKKAEQIYSQLKQVICPEVGIDIVKMGMVKEVIVDGANVDVNLVLTTNICPMAEYLKDQVKRKVLNVGGIKVSVNILDEPWNWDRFKEQT
jgi:serine O-acetyltransferase